jgi:hypothetical protein
MMIDVDAYHFDVLGEEQDALLRSLLFSVPKAICDSQGHGVYEIEL